MGIVPLVVRGRDQIGFGTLSANLGNKALDVVQTGLSAVGLVPGAGEGADLANAAISTARGNYGEAALDLGGALGPVGSGVAVGNRVRKIAGAAGDTAQALKKTDNAADAAKATPATEPYKRPSGATTKEQRQSVQGKPCVDCGKTAPKMNADHKTPLVKEHYKTGTVNRTRMRQRSAVQPQCPTCSNRQGAALSRYSREMKKKLPD